MTIKNEELQAIAKEKVKIIAAIDELRNKVEGGTPASTSDFDKLEAAVNKIHVPGV